MIDPQSPEILERINNYDIFLLSPSPKLQNQFTNLSGNKIKKIYQFNDQFVKAELFKSIN